MLCQFSFKNFMSYRDETVFDLRAENLDEFRDSVISSGDGDPLLPVSVIYGPNGGGKTSLLKALDCALSTVVTPIRKMKKTTVRPFLQHWFECVPYQLDSFSAESPTQFSLFFRIGDGEYHYTISLKNDQIVTEGFFRRSLHAKRTATIFTREGKEIYVGASLQKFHVSTSVNPEMPYLAFLAINFDIPVIAEVEQWFESCIVRNFGNISTENASLLISENNDLKSPFLSTLRSMGIDIDDYRTEQNGSSVKIFSKHMLNGVEYELPLKYESEGTKKLFAVIPLFLLALAEGRLIVLDELDAKLHPKLLRYVISMFTDPAINKHGAQLLFTSHDMSTLNKDVFRRDEIWFAALNEERCSEIYSLYEIRREDGKRVNATAAYDKQYLEGRYGADPYLRKSSLGEVRNERKAPEKERFE